MVNVTISNDIRIRASELPVELVRTVQSELTYPNPAYAAAQRMGYSAYGVPPHLCAYTRRGDVLSLPRGYWDKLVALLGAYGIEYTVTDHRVVLAHVPFDSRIQLRDYQRPAVDALVSVDQGGLCAPCGAGKTQMGLELIARIGQPALWITHTRELMEQTVQRAVDCLGIPSHEIGIIGNGKWSVGVRLTVALVQTLARRDLSDIVNRFGCIVIDEAHHLAAPTFRDVVGQFPARYRYWLTATPERSDGLTDMVLSCGGPIVYTISRADVPTIRPLVCVVETEYSRMYDNFTVQISNLIENRQRNELITRVITHTAVGHYALVLSDRLDHLKLLRGMLRRALPDSRIEILHGGLSKAERQRIMEAARNRDVDILLATKLAKEGLDLPHLDRLYLTTPKRSSGTVEQELGRIMRPCERKTDAVVFDFWDSQNPVLAWQARQRERVYSRLGLLVRNVTEQYRKVQRYA